MIKIIRKTGLLLICLFLLLPLAACQTGGEREQSEGITADAPSDPVSTPLNSSALSTSAITTTTSESTEKTPEVVTQQEELILFTREYTGGAGHETLSPDELPPVHAPLYIDGIRHFSIEFPESWTGRYGIYVRGENLIAFCQQATYGYHDGPLGVIFYLCAVAVDGYEDMEAGQLFYDGSDPLSYMLMGKTDQYAILARFPSDVQYDTESPHSEAIQKEYLAMQEDIYELRFTLR